MPRTKTGSTSTPQGNLTLAAALAGITPTFRKRIIDTYTGLRAAFVEGDHDACGLRAGRFAETLLRFLQNELGGAHTPFGTRIVNFTSECQRLERVAATAGHESLRILMPRALNFVYTLRNKRGIGHVGGDIDANKIDAATAVRIADWCICELIRIYHTLSLEEAQALLDGISVRQVPEVWAVGGKRRVLNPALDYRSQALLLLYTVPDEAVTVEDLFDWTDHSHLSNFKRDVLRPLHTARLIEYDASTQTVVLSPTGAADVEARLLASLT